MNKIKYATILSFVASICFFISYFIGKEVLNLILGCTWLCIAIGNYVNLSKKDK